MKTNNRIFMALTSALLLFSTTAFSQDAEAKTAKYYTVTTMHFNMDNNSDAKWEDVEKEYLNKVTMKNEYVMGAGFYTHLYTSNSTDVKYVQVYASWEDIDKAGARNGELEKAAWPDETARTAFLKKQGDFYRAKHSDEIYSVLPGSKPLAESLTGDMILYVRTSHYAYPEDAPDGEFVKLRKEYIENVINKNEIIKGYYPHRHFWGQNSTDFVEAFFVDSMDALNKMGDRNGELIGAHWTDADARKGYFQKLNKYFTGVHGDEVYTAIAGLRK